MSIKKAFLAAATVCLGVLGGCVSFQVDEHAYQFNEATGSLSLRLLLLNAVRASKDYPLQFTKISAYEGTGTSSASLSASLPLPSLGSGSISPKVDVKDGISELNLVDLNTEEAQQALKRVVPWKVFKYFISQSGNRSFAAPFMLMAEKISISKNFLITHDSPPTSAGDTASAAFAQRPSQVGASWREDHSGG